MNGKLTNYPRTDCLDSLAKTLKGSYFPRECELNGLRGRENSDLREEWRGRGKATLPPSYCESALPTDSVGRQEGRLQFRNAEKLKHFEQLKASNIDDLNCKIQRMISKLSDEVSPSSSIITNSKARFKTEYSDLSTHLEDSASNESHPTLDHLFARERREMIDSEVIKQSQVFQEHRIADHALGHKAEAIRKKYKLAAEGGKGRQMKHEKSMSALNKSSLLEDGSYPSRYDADLIRFRQKLKVNNERGRKELSREFNFPLNFSVDKPTSKPLAKPKRNIEADMRQYEKKLSKYDSKKLICLANEGQIQRIPLGDRTNNNSYLKYSPYSSKLKQPTSSCKLKLKREEHFQANVQDFDQQEGPLTADFRQPSDKNQLKIFLKSLQGQIAVDEQFRNGKKWFERLSEPLKWEELAVQVQLSSLDLDETAIREIFTLKEEEENPFYTPRQDECDCQRLVELFVRCEEHWFENIVKKYNEERLLGCGFKESKLDIAGKGYLSIEDLVRFLSLQMDLQVRNRDLLMIFERLRSEDQLRFWQLVEVICQ